MLRTSKDKKQHRTSQPRKERQPERQPMTEEERAEAERAFEAMLNGEWVQS